MPLEDQDMIGRYFVKEKSVPSAMTSCDLEFGHRLWMVSENFAM